MASQDATDAVNRRRRGSLACNACRTRRTKCDGLRPKCSFCRKRNKDCIYQEVREIPPTRFDMEISAIWERLDQITSILRPESTLGEMSVATQLHANLSRGQDIFPRYPFMVLQSQSFMGLLGFNPSMARDIMLIERGEPILMTHLPPEATIWIDINHANHLLDVFLEQINIWYPVLHASFIEQLLQSIAESFPTSPESCLSLLVITVGSLFECGSSWQGIREQAGSIYLQTALEMLPSVLIDDSIRGVQCLLLFSIYFNCLLRPCRALDFVTVASSKIQNLLKRLNYDADPEQLSMARNCYWIAWLIESELTVQLGFSESGICDMNTMVPIPLSTNVISEIELSNCTLEDSSPISDTSTLYDRLSYFIAEIAIQKLVQRSTRYIWTDADSGFTFAPIVAAELERQMDEWYRYLPDTLCFLDGDDEEFTNTSPHNRAHAAFLRTQYFAFRTSIYWPAAYQAIDVGEADAALLLPCQRFFDSYIQFITSSASAVLVCKSHTWTLLTSVFVISAAAVKASVTLCLKGVVRPEVTKGLHTALRMLSEVSQVSPSLALLRDNLHQYICSQSSFSGQSYTP
ncbi:hypothetical protein BGW36DRAFT_338394 [Talaromyces proteolyticus]|uniref:Zn(2)-C6 fungal-type domain-containing protein n=1 Tax=Talaromyces proteolyticus TaxID=1131652 RepID=A0AAD4KTN9_9EURO|nr:uncharacterized protein BGW36DRAFT_338394 [Talaromyces proteolyticus]KAH8700648.1 hypothetical protein BGW36DRAFT_338394 [Talaromyces proteolyticus]